MTASVLADGIVDPVPTSGEERALDALVLDGVRRSFGTRVAVAGVSFRVPERSTYVLVGPNGAGKTTTITMICGLSRPDAGSIHLRGRLVSPVDPAGREELGFAPQELAVYPDLTGAENLRFFGRLNGLRRGALRERVRAMLAMVGLEDRGDDKVAQYSGGMKRRLNLAAALVHEPRVLVLDEPTAGVDPQSRNLIIECVTAFRDRGCAVLYTTHYMEEAERIADVVGIMDHGRIIEEGAPAQLARRLSDANHLALRLSAPPPERFCSSLRALPGVVGVDVVGDAVQVLGDEVAEQLPRIVEMATTARLTLRGIEVVEPGLEELFLALTGRELRD